MNTNTLIALFKKHPPDGPIIRVEGQDAQEAELKRIAAELSALGRPVGVSGSGIHLRFNTGRPYYDVDLWLGFVDQELRIDLRFHGHGQAISSVAQVHALLQAIEARAEIARQTYQKRDRVRRLQERSADAQVGELARRLGFAYALERTEQRLQLTVKVAGNTGFTLDIPFDAVADRIAAIETLLTTLRSLHEAGLRFRVGPVSHIRQWKEPEREGGDPE